MSFSIDGSAEGGFDTSAGHHVGVGAVLLGVRRLGGPVVGGTWTVVEITIFRFCSFRYYLKRS